MVELSMYWWDDARHGANFGDAVSPRIVKALSGATIHKVRKGGEPRIFACGSILKWAQPGDQIWGSGHAVMGHQTAMGIEVYAVRGPLTRSALMAQGIQCPEVYGDPAVLLPFLYGPASAKRTYKLGVIPHYIDQKRCREVMKDQLERDDVLFIDIMAGADVVLDAIASCSAIASSSLHGIIAAEAYRRRAVWVEFSDQVAGGGMKFRDYYLSLRERMCRPLDWREKASIGAAVDHASLPNAKAMQRMAVKLAASAPFDVIRPVKSRSEAVLDEALGIAESAPRPVGWVETWPTASS